MGHGPTIEESAEWDSTGPADPSPKALGYRMPAEWEPHQATWISWPHQAETWPGKLPAAQRAFASMVAILARSETVHINVTGPSMQSQAQRLLTDAGATGNIRFHHFPTNDAWCRDHGAVFVQRSAHPNADRADAESGLAAVDWQYNAWGNKYLPFDLDDRIAAHMAEALTLPRFQAPMVLEGGSIDVNGDGLLLTTESCLLNPNRNPQLSRSDIEQRLQSMLGVDEVLWLGEGIAGDDTDGHVDDLARFVAPNTVVTAVEEDPDDVNYLPLQDNLERLQRFSERQPELKSVTLPMPPALYGETGRLPASYANFYIANSLVLVPCYHAETDRAAIATLSRLFPNREVIGHDCTDLIHGLGAIHCLTQQVPAG
jgi:agmatine deiminase